MRIQITRMLITTISNKDKKKKVTQFVLPSLSFMDDMQCMFQDKTIYMSI